MAMDVKEELINAVVDGSKDVAVKLAKEILNSDVDLESVVDGLTVGIREVGTRFEKMEIFLPEMIVAAEAMMAVMDVLSPRLQQEQVAVKSGTIVIGTVKGDIHEIGKNIVKLVLKANGFNVIDLGANVDSLDFIKGAERLNADVIAVSTLMTTTMPRAKEIVDLLQAKGLRDKYRVIVGGAPTTSKWAAEIGADGWGDNASRAVDLVTELLEKEA